MRVINYFVGLDLGLKTDFSAISIIERRYEEETECFETFEKPVFNLTYLEKFQIPYPEVVQKIKILFQDSRLRERGSLIVDASGLGAPVISMLEEDRLKPVSIVITAGDVASETKDGFHVPRRHIIGVLMAVFQSARLKVSADLQLAGAFVEELENLTYKIKKENGAMTYETMSQKVHDDLVMATGISLWYAARDGLERRNLSRSFGARVTHVEIPSNLLNW